MLGGNSRAVFLGVVVVLLMLSGCTSTPPVELEELVEQGGLYRDRIEEDRRELLEQGPMTLDRVLALGLQRNLEFRMEALQAALAGNERSLASWNMLPSLTAQAGYTSRDRRQASFSESIQTGQVSLEPSASQDRRSRTHSLELSWNMLDLGLAWFSARGHSDQALLAEERRIGMVHNVTRELVHAWDQALAYQQISDELAQARELVSTALERADQLQGLRMRDPVQVLEYRKSLLYIMREINRISAGMAQARNELARMLDLPAGMPLELDGSVELLKNLPEISASLDRWQLAALINRPEARGAFYEQRIAERSVAERMLRMFPDLILRYGHQYDSNTFLEHNRWEEAGAQVSWNLLQLASWPHQRRQAELERKRAEVATELQMTAILSQVAIARERLESSRETNCLAEKLSEVEEQRVGILASREQQRALDRLTLIKARMDHLLLKLEAGLDRAEYRQAVLKLLASSGVGLTPDSIEAESNEDIRAEIRAWIEKDLEVHVEALFDDVDANFEPAQDDAPVRIGGAVCG